ARHPCADLDRCESAAQSSELDGCPGRRQNRRPVGLSRVGMGGGTARHDAAVKHPISADTARMVGKSVDHAGDRLTPLSPKVAIEAAFLRGNLHRDPADRLLIATARQLGATMITRDTAILAYAAQGHVDAIPC
ncbi:MAG TPA: PIN domain-containing protein, partial [Geminicoccaceae bacterium]|nr:PIN domain-containing protein [Geminicoccaceae bacterium]